MGLSTLVSVSRNVMTLLFSSGVSFSSKISGDRLGRFTRAAGIVKFHHFIQRGFCAIVHIRSAHGYIAQRGCLEGMLHGFELRKNRAATPIFRLQSESWKPPSVNAQPLWQVAHAAFVLKRSNPCLAFSEIADSSPAIHLSKGA